MNIHTTGKGLRFAGTGALGAALALPVLLLLGGCERAGGGPAFARGEAGGGEGAVQPAIPVAVEPAFTGSIASYYTDTATLEVEKEAEVLARVRGIVQSIEVEEGDTVRRDEPLLAIDNDEYLYLLKKAESDANNLRSKLERLKLISSNLVSAEELETAQRDLATAESEEELARLNLSYTTVTAPFNGRVVRRYAEIGHNVSVGTPLFTLADFEPLLARVFVPSREFRKIQVDQPVELVLEGTGARLSGRIKLVSPTIDSKTGTIKVTVEVPEYPEDTRPGDFAEVQIVTEKHTDSILVPRIAVITDKGEQVVFIDAGGVAERRVVEVGFTTDEHSELLSGVRPGERVIVKGQRSLKHGTPIRVLDEDPLSSGKSRNSDS